MKKITISERYKTIIFAILMSLVTSSVVSSIVVVSTRQTFESFFYFWTPSFLKSWPIVFILILIFVPFINKILNTLFDVKKN